MYRRRQVQRAGVDVGLAARITVGRLGVARFLGVSIGGDGVTFPAIAAVRILEEHSGREITRSATAASTNGRLLTPGASSGSALPIVYLLTTHRRPDSWRQVGEGAGCRPWCRWTTQVLSAAAGVLGTCKPPDAAVWCRPPRTGRHRRRSRPRPTRFLAAMMLALVPGNPAAPGLMLTIPRVLWNQPETCTLQTLTVHYGVLIQGRSAGP